MTMAAEERSSNKSKSLIEDAYLRIKQMIFDQKLVPGQKLIYQDLSRMLEMSPTPVINALNRLEQEGFVASEVFRGFYVRPIDPQEVWEGFGVREALETYSVKQAIEVGSAQGMTELEARLDEYSKCMSMQYSKKKFLLDAEFHIQIARMANNLVLAYLLKRNFEHIYLRARLDNYDPKRMPTALRDHRRLIELMKNKDIQGSVELIEKHVRSARDNVIRCLSASNEEVRESS